MYPREAHPTQNMDREYMYPGWGFNFKLGHPNKLFRFPSPNRPTFFQSKSFKENIIDPFFWKFQWK